MATELQAAEVKVRIETEEAVRQVDAIEREQMRRANSRRPGPGDGVERPDGGHSVINGMPETVPIGSGGDARESGMAFGGDKFLTNTPVVEQVGTRAMSNTPIVQSIAETAAADSMAMSQRALSIVGRASSFVASPASALGSELSAASLAAAGPYGAAIAAAAMMVPVASATGPSVEGAASGALMGLFSGSPRLAGAALGVVNGLGLSSVAEAYRSFTAVTDGLSTTASDASAFGFAMARLGLGVDTGAIAGASAAILRTHVSREYWKSRQDIERERIGAAIATYTFEQELERFQTGGAH
jgi:hypothetical protein